MRSVAANCRGFYLRSWRYGSETERLTEEAIERETWNPDRWKIWQEERLSYVLHRAATQVPYYRNYWNQQRLNGNRASWEVLDNWPVLKKDKVRENPLDFVADDCNVRRMICDRTSGTTGTPLSIYLNKETVRKWFALYEARVRRWNGVSIRERWAIMGGQQIVPFDQKNPPFWVYNAGLNQLYLSTFHISSENAKWYIDALHSYNPTHLVAYPSSAFTLALTMLEEGLVPNEMEVIFSNAELLLDEHREIISKAFKCPVRNTYGMGEIAAAATECEKGAMHIWPEVGIMEVFDDEQDFSIKEKVGRLILTGLLNADMPLIRYEVGDRGRLDLSESKCTCGKKLPLLSTIEGRLNDLILTPDGRRIFWLNPVFYNLPIREAQIIQEKLDHIHVRFIPAPGYADHDGESIVQNLHDRVGDVKITLEIVDNIPRSANGKFQGVISRVHQDQKISIGALTR
jgi:phenylacetate-CoA ligase